MRWTGRVLMACLMTAGMAVCALHADPLAPDELLILCYHSVQPASRSGDPYVLTQRRFVEQMEYLHAHDYHPISFDQLEDAVEGRKRLPDRAVLLTFDDGYRSYGDFVVPVLHFYGYPSMLSVVGTWIENGPPAGLSEPLMTWEQIRKAAADPNVTIASHTFDLHKAVQYTPQGNVGALVGVHAYNPADGTYESDQAYRDKLRHDFDRQRDLFLKRLGRAPRAIVWPYGYYNAVSMQVAAEKGMKIGFCLDEKDLVTARLSQPGRLNRVMVLNRPIDQFIDLLKHPKAPPAPMRAAQVDLDLIYTPGSAEQTDRNLGRLIDRLVAMHVNTVFLQAFADPDGSGNIRSVYFHNRVLPVRADIFGHAVHQMHIRGMQVFAWMPTLSFVFPDEGFNQRFRVREYKHGRAAPSTSWYRRLTPFSKEVARRVGMLYQDLAAGALISGVLFQDDAYLTDFEDFHPLALRAFGAHLGRSVTPEMLAGDSGLARPWMHFKTDRLMAYIDGLAAAVRTYRPDARFARNIYARVVLQPAAEQWFAQNYDLFLKRYDYVVVMAYPQMENARRPISWIKDLCAAADRPRMKDKTVFKLQAYDWRRRQWVPDELLLDEMRTALAAGVRHLAYYPDNVWQAKPDLKIIEQELSTLDLPAGE